MLQHFPQSYAYQCSNSCDHYHTGTLHHIRMSCKAGPLGYEDMQQRYHMHQKPHMDQMLKHITNAFAQNLDTMNNTWRNFQ